ncbi:MAG TPA: outer membrane protein transport protein [Ignavibacteriaceae bacterium]|jgi:long-chain fatty acid transport protein|nr:outer membrane protein transport protein [Ignavibacteriaceae bacterium]
MKKLLTIFFAFCVFVTANFGSGFQINEHGARAMGFAGAFTGLANDPSAIYFNPAGIVQLKGTHFSIGSTFIYPLSKFTGPSPSTTESNLKKQFFTPFNFYISHQINNDLFVGFGVNNPFGLGTKWEDDWVGRYRTTETEIRTFNFSPVVAYKLSECLSASVGFTVSYSDVLIARRLQILVPTGNPANPYMAFPDGTIEMKGDKTAFGYNASLFYMVDRALSFGLAFKSQIKYDYKGDATVTLDPTVPAAVKSQVPSGTISAPLTTPMVLTFGTAYKVFNNMDENYLTLSFDFQYNGWKSYDKLEVTFDEFKPAGTPYVSTSERDFQNSFILRLGAEYVTSDRFTLRGGVLYDKNPIKDERLDPTLPDADRIGLNLGMSYKITNNLSVDLAYLFLMFKERTISSSKEFIPLMPTPVELKGTYSSSAHLIGLNFNYSL